MSPSWQLIALSVLLVALGTLYAAQRDTAVRVTTLERLVATQPWCKP